MSTDYKTYLVNVDPKGSNTQRFEVKVKDGKITATANKKLSGLKPAELIWKNGQWSPQNQDARNFIKYKPNLENLCCLFLFQEVLFLFGLSIVVHTFYILNYKDYQSVIPLLWA